MRNRLTLVAITATLSLSMQVAFAGNPVATLTVTQEGKSWSQNMSGLLVLDEQNNFSLRQGAGTSGLYGAAGFVDSASAGQEYWAWNPAVSDPNTGKIITAANWSWHSAETLSNITPLATTSEDPWMAVVRVSSVIGHGDPDISYAFSASNNTLLTQTYSFMVGESILPTINTANVVHADVSGGLTTKDGAVTIAPISGNTTIQHFRLSSDNGVNFVNAGVDVGLSASATTTATYGVYASDASGPTNQTWNYIQIVSQFTLTAKDSAGLVGYASITAVPEPESYAMLLAGLGLIGYLARRRNARRD